MDQNNNDNKSKFEWTIDMFDKNIPGLKTAEELAEKFKDDSKTVEEQVDALIRNQMWKIAFMSFFTSLPGFLLIFLNVLGVVAMQMRLVACIAILSGYDLGDSRVKNLIRKCFAASMAYDSLGKAFLVKSVVKLVKKTFLRVIPGIGGIVGCVSDIVSTKIIINIAKKTFMSSVEDELIIYPEDEQD